MSLQCVDVVSDFRIYFTFGLEIFQSSTQKRCSSTDKSKNDGQVKI